MTRLPTTVGSSETAALFGCSPWISEFALFADKAGLLMEEEPRSAAEEERLAIGKELEGPILDIWARRNGKYIRRNAESRRNNLYPGISATPDGFEVKAYEFMPANKDPVVATLEAKTIQPWERREWAQTGTPLYYRIQVQQQVTIEGVPGGWLIGLFGVNEIAAEWLPHDPILEEKILEKVDTFWKRVRGELPPPEPDNHRATLSALMAQRRESKTIELGQDAWDLREQWQTTKKELNAAKKQEAALKAKIVASLGPFDRGVFGDGSGFALQMQERKGHVVKASKFYKLVPFAGENAEEESDDE